MVGGNENVVVHIKGIAWSDSYSYLCLNGKYSLWGWKQVSV